jgi:putative transposase
MIDRKHENVSILRQAELLGISRASIYYKQNISEEDMLIMNTIDKIFTDIPVIYGARKLRQHLRDYNFYIGRGRTRRLMREMGIHAIYPQKRCCTSSSNKKHKKYPYLLRGKKAAYSNHIWGTDITYIRLEKSFCYLVAHLDWYSRYVLAWELSNSLEADFCISSLNSALQIGKPLIHNSDQGCQFTSEDYTNILSENKVQISMDGRGRCLDNIFTERLWRTVKYEDVYLRSYSSIEEAREGLSAYFKFYNTIRKHQSLDYRTPEGVFFSSQI